MTATAEIPLSFDQPVEASQAVARLNERLAASASVPDDVAAGVHALAEAVLAHSERWEAVDPYVALRVHRAVIAALEAVHDREAEGARDRLRLALERLRQGLVALAEIEPVGEERSSKEIAVWLAETTEVPQARLAELLGVSLRKLQRWLSPTEGARPEGDDARRLRAVAQLVNVLRFTLTPAGAVEWLTWARDDLGGRRPIDILDDPGALPELLSRAGAMRATVAA